MNDSHGRNTVSQYSKIRKKNGYHTGLSYRISVKSARVTEDADVTATEMTSQPYWSWTPCAVCDVRRPPRAHHCPLCRACVLKRDHHCFLTGACIAVNNQRYFIIFLFWCIFGTTLGLVHIYPHFSSLVFQHVSYVDFIPPLCMARWVLGYVAAFDAYYVITLSCLQVFNVTAIIMCAQIVKFSLSGTTSFENEHRIRVKDSRSVSERWREVMGGGWGWTMLVPYKRICGPWEDAVNWPSIQPE